jgi:RNA polymerase sigma factor (sigma-70 family)
VEPVSLSTGPLRGPLLRLQSDDRLARLAADGVDAAFELLVRRYRPKLVRACAQILSGPQAEDAVQQSLLSAQQALLRNGAPDRFEPWLHRIALNAALKELRRMPEDLPLNEDRVNGSDQPPESHERRETLQQTIKAIRELPARQRRALVLRELEGRSHAEIARSLGLTSGAVRQLIHRARSSVRSAVSAVTPYPLLVRLAETEGQAPVAELIGGGTASAVAGKTLVAALVAGGVAGGVALAPDEKQGKAQAAGVDRERVAASPAGSAIAPRLGQVDDSGDGAYGAGSGTDDNSRPGDSSGPGSGRDDDSDGDNDSSGPGGGGSGSSGSGGGDSGGSGSSGSGSSGSGSSGSGSSGSGSSGSGSSGSGSSGSSLSGSSDSSGSGSSGSGSEDGDSPDY